MSGPSVGVLDYGIGNVGSVLSMHRRLSISAGRVTTPEDFAAHDRFLLPGVGAFDRAIRQLRESGLDEPLREHVVVGGRPLLGICLGMQMLADRSEEGDGEAEGLGWIPGVVRAMRPMLPPERRLPFMGWAYLEPQRESALFDATADPQRFYLVHSYAFVPERPADVVATVDYGAPVTAVVNRDNVWGTQFHPEKSHRFGMALLERFAAIDGPR